MEAPTWLIHQKVYSTSKRLPFLLPLMKPVIVEEKAIVSVADRFGKNPLLTDPWLSRFYWCGSAMEYVLFCRSCKQALYAHIQRTLHNECQGLTAKLLMDLTQLGKCIMCEKELGFKGASATMHCPADFYGVPVCSKFCMERWGAFSPQAFDDLHKKVVNENPVFAQMIARVRRKMRQEI